MAGWAPRILVNDTGSTEFYSLLSNAGGLFAINTTSGALSAHGNWPLPAARRHDLIVGADYGGGSATRTVAVEVFGALSLDDDDVAQNAATVGQEAGGRVSGIVPLVRADGAAVASGIVWTLTDRGGLFRAGTSSGAILLTRRLSGGDVGVSTVTLTASYAGAEASLPLPIVVTRSNRVYICDRSDRVQRAILEMFSPDQTCDAFSTGRMERITALTVTSGGSSVQLRAGDFADMPNLQALDLRNNGILVLPEHLFSGVTSGLSRLDIRGNPVTRIPLQVLADWDDGTSTEALFVDPEDRIAGFQYRVDGTTVPRLVLLEDDRITMPRGIGFQVVLPPAFPQLSERSFSASRDALNTLEGEIRLLSTRFRVPSQIRGLATVQDKSILWTSDEDFEEETTERTLVWEWADSRVFWSEGNSNRLRVEAFPVEVRESFVLRDGDTRPNRIEAGAPGGSPVTGWRAQPAPSASAAFASGLTYEYALVSDAGGLFTINTANGALLVASGQSPNIPGTHHVVVMATAIGPRLTLTATAQAAIEVVAGVNICARTEAARAAILAATSDDDRCAMVRPSQLAGITTLTVTSDGGSVQLQAGDFADLPNLQALDLRNNGIRDLPANILDDIPARANGGFYWLDIRNNPITRIPPQIVAYMDTVENGRGTDNNEFRNYLLIDEEDRLPVFEYAPDVGQATTLSRLVLHEGRAGRFQVFPPAGVAGTYFPHSFELDGGVLHQGASWTVTVTSAHREERNLLAFRDGMSTLTMAVSLDDNFAVERRRLRWRYLPTRVDGYLRFGGFRLGESTPFGLFTEDFPVEVREALALGDGNPAPNRIAAGARDGASVTGWEPQPMPSASTMVAAGLAYEYALLSDAGGLFVIDTASGALSLAPGQSLSTMSLTHRLTVEAAVDGPDFTLTATTEVTVLQDTGFASICDRTPAVQRAILRQQGGDDCAFVAMPLTFTTTLRVTGSVTALKRGDFRGVSGVGVASSLLLQGLGLQSLSSDVFEGVVRISILDITENNLNSLPADILDHLQAGLCSIRLYANPLDRLPMRLLADLKRLAPPSCSSRPIVPVSVHADGVYPASAPVSRQPDYLGNIRYIDADTGRVVSSQLDLIEGERRRIQVELDALPGINGEISLQWHSASTLTRLWRSTDSRIRLSLEPPDLTLGFSSETTRTAVTITAEADDNREHETVLLSWFNASGPTLHEGTRTVALQLWPYDGRQIESPIGFRTPPLSVRVLEPVEVEDTNPEPNRIWRGAAAGAGVVGWAPRVLVDDIVSTEVSYSLASDAGGLFAIDTASGVLSTRGVLPPSSVRRHDLVVGADYRGAPATLTAPIEVFGALSLEDADAAENAAAVGQMAGEPVSGTMPVVRADAAAVTSGVVWTLSGGDGLFRLDTPSRTILLARQLMDRDFGVSTVTLTASYGGAEARLPLPVVISLPGRVNICDRTPVVQQAILGQKGGDNCALVSEPLAFNNLSVGGSATVLKRGDFRGVIVTRTLSLRRLGLKSLSSDVFEGVGIIGTLDIRNNNLGSLPADLLDHLPAGLCEIRLYSNPLDRLPIRLLANLRRLASACRPSNAIVYVDGVYSSGVPRIYQPDYLGNIRYIDADTGRVVSSQLDLIEGEPRRIQVELDALPGINGEISLRGHSDSTLSNLWGLPQSRLRLSLGPRDLTLRFSSETIRRTVTITAGADDNREHETVLLSWVTSGTTMLGGAGSGVTLQLSAFIGNLFRVPNEDFRTPPLSVRVLEPIDVEDTNPEPNRIWRGVAAGTGVVGWAPQTLVDSAASTEVRYSLVSDAGGLFAIDTASGVLSTRGALPPSSVRRHDLVVGADYRGATVTLTAPVEVFGALSLEDDDVAQNAATVGQMAGEPVSGLMPVVRADAAAVTSGVVWALSGGGGLFRLDTPSRTILLTRELMDRHIGISTVTLTASYGGAEASLLLPVVISLPGRVNICDRTPVVQTAILAKTPAADTCDSVSLAEMGRIDRLRVTADGAVATLSNLDFRRLPGLSILNLNDLGLRSLPAAIFRSSTALQNLNLRGNDEMAFLPVRLLADLGHLNTLQVPDQVRVGDIHYRVDGEVTTETLVISEDESRDVLVEADGGLHIPLTLTFQVQGAPVVATPTAIEIGPFAAARSVRLSATADADIVHNRGPVSWRWNMAFNLQRDNDDYIPTPDLVVRVNETVALTDTAPAANRLREDAADDVAVSGWSPQVTAGGVGVPTTAVSYRLTADAGGLFEVDSATGALSLADRQSLDYAASSRHTVTVEANYDGVAAALSVTVDVINVTDICSRTDAVENAILAATPADDACGSVLASELRAIRALTVTAAATFLTEADFDGLPNLEHLDLIAAGAVRLPVQFVASFGREVSVARLRVDRRARLSGLIYRDDESGEVITPPLVVDEGATRTLRVATSGVLGRMLRFSLDRSGLRGVTATDSIELGSPSTPTLELTALTDEDFDPVSGVLAWALEPGGLLIQSPAGAGFARHDLLTEGLRVEVREADVFEDANPADNRISEASAVNTAVSGWTPRVLVSGVQTTAVRYSLTGDAGGLFGIESASGALLLAGELDYETSTFHGVEVAAWVPAIGVTASLAAVVRVDNAPELSFGGVAAGVISEAAAAGVAVSGVAVSLLDDGVSRGDEGIVYELTGEGSEVFNLSVSGNVAGLQLANRPLDRETTPVYSLMLSGSYLGASISTRVSVRVENVVEEVVLAVSPDVFRFDEGTPPGTTVGVTLVVKTEDDVTRTDGVMYALTGSEAFQITTGGVVLVSGALDYETTASHTLMITATYEGVTSNEARVTVNVEDLSLSLSGTTVGTIKETATPDTMVSGIEISALFGGTTVTTAAAWELSGTGTEVFRITTDGGLARLQLSDVQLDRETTPAYTLLLRASYLGESTSTRITVNVQNAVERVTLEAMPNVYQIREDASSGTVVGVALVVKTEDGVTRTDGVIYSLTGSESFRITTIGAIVVSGALDYEETASHLLTITATYEGVTSNEARVTVNVEDLSLSLSGTVVGTIKETAAPDTAVAGIEVSALFGGTTVTTAAAWELSGTGTEVFRITTDGGIARLRLSDAELDRETTPAYTLLLRASYLGESTSTRITVNVQNAVERVTLEATPDVYQIREDASSGTVVGVSLVVKTEDGVTRIDGVSYSLTGSESFRITTIGAIVVSGALDYEETASHLLTITATYEGVTSDEAQVTVNVEDLSLSLSGTTVGTIKETAMPDTMVSGIEISALFGGTTVTTAAAWELSGTGTEVFRITTDGGLARLQLSDAELDRETTPAYTLLLRASYLGESTSTRITVNVQNAVERVTLEATPDVYQIREDASSGTVVGVGLVVKTEDGVTRTDGVSYSLTGSESFRITTVGAIVVLGALDYEETASHLLTITATYEGVTSDEVRVTVNVEDLSLSLSGTTVGTIKETAVPDTMVSGIEISALFGGTTVTTAAAWELSGTGTEVFRITTDGGLARLQLSDVQLDHETTPTYTLTLATTYLSNESTSTRITVNVQNAVERVTLEATPDVYQIREDASSGTVVGVALVVKTEDGVTRTDGVMYSLTGSEAFEITTGGAVLVAGALDYETTASHTLMITATYEGVTSDEALVTVDVEDLSLSLSGTVTGIIAENAVPDTAVTGVEISALFGETMVTTAAAWALSGTGAETFRITTDTGIAHLQLSDAELDYGTTPIYTLSLRASWLGETTAVSVTVEVGNVDSLLIELTGNPPHTVAENAPLRTRVGDARLTARTEDGTPRTSEADWHISGAAADLFAITSTGDVIVAGALDYETSTLHTLTITASWQSLTSNEERLAILVANVERDPQLVDLNSAPNTALNTTDARVAGLNLAFLTDGVEQTGNVEWIFATATPARTTTAFTINTATGVITLNNPITATLPQTYEATVTATQTDRTASLPLSIRVVSGLTVRIRVFLEGAVIP